MKDNENISQITRSELKEIIFECLEELDIVSISEGFIYSNNKYSIHMDGMKTAGINYYADPYIKIYDNPSWNKAKNCLLYFFKDKTIGYHNEHKGDLRYKTEIGKFLTNTLAIEITPGFRVVDKLNREIYERYANEPNFDHSKLYVIKLDDYSNATYRNKPERKEY